MNAYINNGDQAVLIKKAVRKTVALIFCLFVAGTLQAQTAFSKLVVFGDSLSDTGNLALIDLPSPYFDNRISNGPVLADLLAQSIGSNAERSGHLLGSSTGFNYAVAGGNIVGDDPEDLSSQVTAFLQRVDNSADTEALYFVFAGGNDLRGLRSQASPMLADVQIAQFIAELDLQMSRLVTAGARAFLVPNVANIGRLPETIERESGAPGLIARAETYSRRYNQALNLMLDKYRANSNISIVEFDLFAALEDILNNADQFGFNNIEEGCFDPDGPSIELECVLFGFESRPFFDQLHPSSATNQFISVSLIQNLPELLEGNRVSAVIPAITVLLLEE